MAKLHPTLLATVTIDHFTVMKVDQTQYAGAAMIINNDGFFRSHTKYSSFVTVVPIQKGTVESFTADAIAITGADIYINANDINDQTFILFVIYKENTLGYKLNRSAFVPV